MKTHTPGPWKIGFGGMDGDTFATITSDFAKYPICQLEPNGYSKANAELIANAPSLLALLEAADANNRDLLAANTRLREALTLAQATIERLTVKHGPFSSTQGTMDVINTALASTL